MQTLNRNSIILISAATLLAACGEDGRNGTNGADGTNGLTGLIEQTVLPTGDSNCALGGLRIDSGLDANGNGALDQSEISTTEYACESVAFQLQLLHFADVDGGRDILNNAVNFSALVKQFRVEFSNTLLLSSGDNWIPGPEYNVASDDKLAGVLGVTGAGRAHVALLNALKVDASALGNHEFDLGPSAIAEIIGAEVSGDTIWPGAQFPYLASNIDFSEESSLSDAVAADLVGGPSISLKNKIASSTIVDVNGEKVGVVGAITPTLSTITSPGSAKVFPENSSDLNGLASEIQKSVDALTEAGINKIILLAHMQQLSVERSLAPLLKNVDIIVAGGSNTLLADANDTLRDGDIAADVYPLTYQSENGEPVLVVNTDGDYTYLGRLVVEFDKNGVIIPSSLDDRINGAYATDLNGLAKTGVSNSEAIEGVKAISYALTSALTERAGNVFGLTSVYLNGDRASVRTQETNLGNLTAEANLDYAQASDANVAISIKNGGGIRASIGQCSVPAGATGAGELVCLPPAGIEGIRAPGEISQLDLEISLRFNNSLSLVSLTGAQLKAILEHSVAATEAGATPGRFPQVAGIEFSFDASKTAQVIEDGVVTVAGERIQSLRILDANGAVDGAEEIVLVADGQLQTEFADRVFRVVTLGFLVEGGDGYPFPSDESANVVSLEQEGVQIGNATFADEGTEQDALAEYLFANFPADDDENTPAYDKADTAASEDKVIIIVNP